MAFEDAWGFDGLTYSGKEMRELVETLTGGLSGVVGGTNAVKVSQQTVATSTVKVAEGGAIIPATGAGLGGSFQVYNDADLTSPAITPTAANGRKDRLIIRVTAGVPALEIVEGVASGSPAEPSITGDNYLELALITLPASTTNITDAMITDRRARFAAGGPVICTSSTRPASPYEGQEIYETDTDREYIYTGTVWRYRSGGTDYTAARAYASAATAVGGSVTVIALATESYDYGGNFAGNTYTCPRAGLLDVRARTSVGFMDASQRIVVAVYVNGVEASRGPDSTSVGTNPLGGVVSDLLAVAAGDTVTLRAQLVGGTGDNCETGAAVTYLACRMLP